MEFKFGDEDAISKVEQGDLAVNLSACILISNRMGSLLLLRQFLREQFTGLIFFTMSRDKLYVAKWHDLTPEKQGELQRRRKT